MEQQKEIKSASVALSFIEKNKHVLDKTVRTLKSIDGKVITPVFTFTDDSGKKLEKIKKRMDTLNSTIIKPLVEITGGENSKIKPIQDRLQKLNTKITPVIELAGGISGELVNISAGINKLKNFDPNTFKTFSTNGVNAFNSLKSTLSSFNVGLVALKIKTIAASAAQLLFNAAMWSNPITWVVIGVIALIAALLLVVKNWDKVKATISRFTNWFKSTFSYIGDWFKNLFSSIGNWLKKNWKTLITIILIIAGPIGWAILALVKIIRNNWNAIKETTMKIWNAIVDSITGVWNKIKNTAASIWKGVSDFFSGIWDGIKANAESCWNWIGNIIGGVGDSIKNAWNSVVNWFSEKFSWISGMFSQILNNPLFKFISGTAKSVVNFVSTGITNIRDDVFGKDAKVDSSNACGLSYVPFDGYIAELHKGERVLTASESKSFSSLGTSSSTVLVPKSGNTFNISINGVNKSTNEIMNELVARIKEAAGTMGEVAYSG